MSSEFHPLASPQGDYAASSEEGGTSMDDVSLSSSRAGTKSHAGGGGKNNPLSSGASVASVSSRLSRAAGRKRVQNSELGVPLTASSHGDGDEEQGGIGGGNNSNGSGHGVVSPTTAAKRKSYISEDDPFHIFRSDLFRTLSTVDENLEKYLNVVRTTDTAANVAEVKDAKKQLKRHIKHAESSLGDLESTIRVVERAREKFPHITDNELDERRKFIEESREKIDATKRSMNGDEVRSKLSGDDRALRERRRGGGSPKSQKPNGAADDNRGVYANPLSDPEEGMENDPDRAETLMMMQKQDETLDDLGMAVTRVGYMAETIHEEIDTQNVMLKNLDEDLADAEEQLGVVMGKLAKLLKTKSRCQLGLIVGLCLVVLVLFFLVLYT